MCCRIFVEYFSPTLHARVKRSFATVSTHTQVCVSEQVNSRLHQVVLQDESIQGGLDHEIQVHTHMCVLQKNAGLNPKTKS